MLRKSSATQMALTDTAPLLAVVTCHRCNAVLAHLCEDASMLGRERIKRLLSQLERVRVYCRGCGPTSV